MRARLALASTRAQLIKASNGPYARPTLDRPQRSSPMPWPGAPPDRGRCCPGRPQQLIHRSRQPAGSLGRPPVDLQGRAGWRSNTCSKCSCSSRARPANRRICWLLARDRRSSGVTLDVKFLVWITYGPHALSPSAKKSCMHRLGRTFSQAVATASEYPEPFPQSPSPDCAQRLRRVCTACPQACAHDDSTAAATR